MAAALLSLLGVRLSTNFDSLAERDLRPPRVLVRQLASSTDDRVAGVLTWNYGGCAACNGSHWTPPHTCCMDEIGTKDMPKALAAWQSVGRKLIGA